MKKILAVILARGGSKGIPGKNIIDVAGKPLLQYSIEAVAGLDEVVDCVVSSDDDAILKVAKDLGASVVERPSELAHDTATSESALEHAILESKKRLSDFDTILLLQPTSPLRTKIHVAEAIEKFSKRQRGHSLVSVAVSPKNPYLFKHISDQETLKDMFPVPEDQDYPLARQANQAYYINGAIYLVSVDYFLKTKSLYCDNMNYYLMSKQDSLDVDDYFDLELARYLLTTRKGKHA